MLIIWRAVVIVLALVAPSCGGAVTTPTPPASSPTPPAPPGRPTLLAPEADAVVPQNDAASGCAFHASAGFGSRVAFDWADVPAAAGLAGYEIYVEREGAAIPIVNASTQGSEHVYLACASYVIDRNLENWIWKVRAVDRNRQFGEWAERRFSFAPCRIGRRVCGT